MHVAASVTGRRAAPRQGPVSAAGGQSLPGCRGSHRREPGGGWPLHLALLLHRRQALAHRLQQQQQRTTFTTQAGVMDKASCARVRSQASSHSSRGSGFEQAGRWVEGPSVQLANGSFEDFEGVSRTITP